MRLQGVAVVAVAFLLETTTSSSYHRIHQAVDSCIYPAYSPSGTAS
jgi:hypothetical protein